jgi:hypothetical protein
MAEVTARHSSYRVGLSFAFGELTTDQIGRPRAANSRLRSAACVVEPTRGGRKRRAPFQRKKLEEDMIGDSPVGISGIAYVCIGLVMAHLSEDIGRLLSWIGLS